MHHNYLKKKKSMVQYKKYKDLPDELQERIENIILDFKVSIHEYDSTFQINVLLLMLFDFFLDCENPKEVYELFLTSLKRMMDQSNKGTGSS